MSSYIDGVASHNLYDVRGGREAEKIGGVILWDGGNNDWLFFKPHYMVVAADAMRPGLEISVYLGEVNVRIADAVIITGYWHKGGHGMVAITALVLYPVMIKLIEQE
jgi:hypothetical protein